MGFLTSFTDKFTEEEQRSRLFQQVASIGQNVELELIQDVQGLINKNVDITAMDEDGLKKILAFFYLQVRNFVQAYGYAKISLLIATGVTSIPKGSIILASNGTIFYTVSDLVMYQGDVKSIGIKQGIYNSYTGTYSAYISYTIESVDLDSLKLYINSVEIPKVTTTATNKVIRPVNGFVAFYFNGMLYVKIFAGEDVPVFEGQSFILEFYTCDGVFGNIDENNLSRFSGTIYDINGKSVTYAMSNEAITNGQSSPPKYEILDLLRYWMFTKDSVSKISDYRNFFLSQPEVGDGVIEGDYERYLRTGIITVTGKVTAVIINKSGEASTTIEIKDIDARLAIVKDIGFVEYSSHTVVYHYYLIRYRTVQDVVLFQNESVAAVNRYYTLTDVRNNGDSLFDGLDLLEMINTFPLNLLPIGLDVIPYYFKRVNLINNQAGFNLSIYSSLLRRGAVRYVYTYNTGTGSDVVEEWYEIRETETLYGIYDSTNTKIGEHNYTAVDENLEVVITKVFSEMGGATGANGRVEIYGEIKDKGYVQNGGVFAKRVLQGVDFELY